MSTGMPEPPAGGSLAGGQPLLALDFGGTKVAAALAGPGQRLLARVTLPTRPEHGAGQVIDRALAAARGLLRDAGAGRAAAVGVSTMGLTREDGVDLAPNVPGWEKLRLPAIFRAAFPGVPLELGNDVRAAALAELAWGELAGVDTGLYVNLGTGVAATLIIGGAVFTGGHGAAGEIGYWLCPGVNNVPGAGPGTFEAVAGGAGVRRRARELGIDGGLAELLAAADPAARALADDVIEQVSLHLTNLAIAFDPQLLVIGGGYAGAGERILAALRGLLERYCPFPPRAVIGRFGTDVGLYGAVALAETALRRQAGRPGTAG